jgi:HlyD family secretion protein
MTDFARDPAILKRRRRRRMALGAVGVLLVIGATVVLSRMEPAPPSVPQETLLMGTVERGTIIRQVRGLGKLVPEDIRWIPATTDGRVDRIVLRPGARVTPESVILELSSPAVEQEYRNTRLALQSAEASLVNFRVQNDNALLAQQSNVAQLTADYEQARLQSEADAALAKQDLISDLQLSKSKSAFEVSKMRLDLAKKQLASLHESQRAQLRVQETLVEQAAGAAALAERRRAELRVRPPVTGVLQVVGVEVGETIGPGKAVARVADPSRLKAELKIPEQQARDVEVGQQAEIDTHAGVIPGVVSRKDPAAANGTVTVDVTLTGELTRGAVPDLSVDGVVQLERLENVLHVARPAFGQEESTVSLFRLIAGTSDATRVQVALGRGSVNSIQVRSGLQEGDRVVLSDMSTWDSYDRVRLR